MTSRCSIKNIKLPDTLLPATHSVRINKPIRRVIPTLRETHTIDQKEGVQRPKTKRFQTSWNPAKDQVVIDLLKEGKKRKEIADELGVSVGSVQKRIQRMRRHGVQI